MHSHSEQGQSLLNDIYNFILDQLGQNKDNLENDPIYNILSRILLILAAYRAINNIVESTSRISDLINERRSHSKREAELKRLVSERDELLAERNKLNKENAKRYKILKNEQIKISRLKAGLKKEIDSAEVYSYEFNQSKKQLNALCSEYINKIQKLNKQYSKKSVNHKIFLYDPTDSEHPYNIQTKVFYHTSSTVYETPTDENKKTIANYLHHVQKKLDMLVEIEKKLIIQTQKAKPSTQLFAINENVESRKNSPTLSQLEEKNLYTELEILEKRVKFLEEKELHSLGKRPTFFEKKTMPSNLVIKRDKPESTFPMHQDRLKRIKTTLDCYAEFLDQLNHVKTDNLATKQMDAIYIFLKLVLIELALTLPAGKEKLDQINFRNNVLYNLDLIIENQKFNGLNLFAAVNEYVDSIEAKQNDYRCSLKLPDSPLLKEVLKPISNLTRGQADLKMFDQVYHSEKLVELTQIKSSNVINDSLVLSEACKRFVNDKLHHLMVKSARKGGVLKVIKQAEAPELFSLPAEVYQETLSFSHPSK